MSGQVKPLFEFDILSGLLCIGQAAPHLMVNGWPGITHKGVASSRVKV
jgi:hypothetical protein